MGSKEKRGIRFGIEMKLVHRMKSRKKTKAVTIICLKWEKKVS